MEQTPTLGTISSGFGITKYTSLNDGSLAESKTETLNSNKPTEKYIQYFSNGEDDLDDETLKKILKRFFYS